MTLNEVQTQLETALAASERKPTEWPLSASELDVADKLYKILVTQVEAMPSRQRDYEALSAVCSVTYSTTINQTNQTATREQVYAEGEQFKRWLVATRGVTVFFRRLAFEAREKVMVTTLTLDVAYMESDE